MLKRTVILIGMPGSGKTTVGKQLAKKQGAAFLDTDNLIIEQAGKPLQTIIEEQGREAFTVIESKAIKSVKPNEPMVIATGGSAVLNDEAMQHLKSIGTVVFLDADLPLIRKRLWNVKTRGIVLANENETIERDNVQETLLKVYKEREPLYFKYSDIKIHIRGMGTNKVVQRIIEECCN